MLIQTPFDKGIYDARNQDVNCGPEIKNPFLKGTDSYKDYNKGIAEYYKQKKLKEIY